MVLSCVTMGILQSLSILMPGKFYSISFTNGRLPKEEYQSCTYGLPKKIFFPVYGKRAGITNDTNNSEPTRYVRNPLGVTGFLMVQIFYSQEIIESILQNGGIEKLMSEW